jgi:D-alanine-D-alanine ligase-like ATP-grasp enzyme
MSKHVAVLMGGWSSERQVSLWSGKACADAAERFYAQRGLGDQLMAALLRQVDRVDEGWRA